MTTKRPARLLSVLALVLVLGNGTAHAQDRRGEITLAVPEYQGVKANAPIEPKFHVRNEGGSDGAGLCVISSVLIDGAYQGVPGLEGLKQSKLWQAAKGRPGGYYPHKLEGLLKELMPDEKWFSWEGENTDLVKEYSAKGYPVAATMSTGALYGYRSIHHMISVVHLDDKWACIVDNNDPGKYHWMPATEYARRYRDGHQGWGFVWLRLPPQKTLVFLVYAASLLLASAALLVLTGARRGRLEQYQ